MQLKSFFFSLGTSVIALSSLTMVHMAEAASVLSSDQEPELQKLGSDRKLATGSVKATINGKEEAFMTTAETIQISEERIKAADPRAQETLRKMNGRVVETAVVRAIASTLYVSLDAYGNIGETGPQTGSGSTSLKLEFALTPDTFSLHEKNREMVYTAPGQRSREGAMAKDYELTIDSITKLPQGALALKGSFSGTLKQDRDGKDLAKPVEVKGTFDIHRLSANDMVMKLLQGK